MPPPLARKPTFRDCAESVYLEQDASRLDLLAKGENGLDIATEYWYTRGESNMNPRTGTPVVPAGDPTTGNAYLHIIWKTTKKVGLGIKDKWVVAWYCDVAPLSNLVEAEVAKVESSPLYEEPAS